MCARACVCCKLDLLFLSSVLCLSGRLLKKLNSER